MSRRPLTTKQIDEALAELDGWRFEADRLQKAFTFKDFREAMGFVVRLAFVAEAMDHHPELRNVYNRVELALNTHDAGGKVTELDVRLAQAIESFSWV